MQKARFTWSEDCYLGAQFDQPSARSPTNTRRDAMTTGLSLSGIRTRDGRMVRINAILLARENENCWRARILPAEIVQVGDRLRFGDTSGSPACFLAFLDADIIEGNGDDALLSFHFTGTALEEALDRLGDTSAGDVTQSAGGHVFPH